MHHRLAFAAVTALAASALLRPAAAVAPVKPAWQADPPAAWAEGAVWYQIFPERFANGDPTNDPTLHDAEGAWPHDKPAGWAVTPWEHDWYAPDPWAAATGVGFYEWVQHRRYGGDLQGILDRLDHVQALGCNALYLNPVNDSPSLHKYDARAWHHVDRNLGPDPRGDEALVAQEDPGRPSTWVWTAADLQLIELVAEVHRRGMRIVLDFSWNHTGATFWAFRDLVEKQRDSAYADWYAIERFDDPSTPEGEFAYSGWAGVRELPEIRETGVPEGWHGGPAEGDLAPGPKAHIFSATSRWLDPDGDGDPSDGVDGFRLDVAERVPLGFWRDWRAHVKDINPDALLVGEIWWEQWPLTMMDPAPYLEHAFDSVMHYRWYAPARAFLGMGEERVAASRLAAIYDSLAAPLPPAQRRSLMWVAGSHDSPRVATSLGNKGRYKAGASPRWTADYRVGPPDPATKARLRLLRVLQCSLPGAPHVFAGDEFALAGADDPDNRKPVPWPDLPRDPERATWDGGEHDPWDAGPELEHLDFLKTLFALRAADLELVQRGERIWRCVDDEAKLLVWERRLGGRRLLVAANAGDDAASCELAGEDPAIWRDRLAGSGSARVEDGTLRIEVPALTALWLERED